MGAMEKFLAIKCSSCSGAMYSDQKTASYICPFCGASEPWTEENFYRELPITFRHKPVERIDGLIKLGQVEVMSSVDPHDERLLSQRYRLNSVADKLALWDPITERAFSRVEQVIFACPFCGGEITGESTQHIFQCGFCNNKIGAEEALRPGAYRKEFIMGVGAEDMPGKAIPFKVTREQAKTAVRALIRKFSGDFIDQDIENRMATDMTADYIPFSLADLSVKMSVQSNRGDFQAYEEIINWACPDTTLYDIHLLDRLDPWDFGEVVPFDPAFAEGDFRIAAQANNASRVEVIDNILAERLVCDLKETFTLKKAKIMIWGRDFRKHKGATFLLPVYYFDRRLDDTEKSRQVRIAVNGQTGKAAVLFYQYRKEETYRTMEPHRQGALSPERTLRMPPVPVVRVKAPFLHRVVPIEDAVEKKWFRKLLPW